MALKALHSPNATLLNLPIEVLAHIVREVGITPGRGGNLKPLHKNILALSQVNLGLWHLCKPAIWKSPDLSQRDNADLLYFLTVILPRHHSLILLLQGVHAGNDRLDLGVKIVPTYLQEALGIYTSLSTTPDPTLDAVDLKTLGEKVLLPLGSIADPTSDDLVHASSVASQRAKILSLILAPSNTPYLTQIKLRITTRDLSYERHLVTLRQALGESRLLYLHVELEDPVHPLDPYYERRSYSALAKLISRHPDIEDLSIQQQVVDMSGTNIDALDSRPTDIDPSLLTSIRELKSLERLALIGLPIRKSCLMDLCTGPLKAVKIDRLEISWGDCVQFLNESHTTLISAALLFYGGPHSSDQQPVPFSFVKPFPSLKRLHIGGMIPTSILTNFKEAPLEYLDTWFLEESSLGEWRGFLEDHKGTLESLVINRTTLKEGERVEVERDAIARGMEIKWKSF